jgi:DNA ligase (NAD+)
LLIKRALFCKLSQLTHELHNLITNNSEMLSKIAELPGWGEVSSQNVADSIGTVSAEGVTLSRFIYSLGIPFIGTHASQLLASQYGNLASFLDALEYASKYENDSSCDENVDDNPFGALAEVKGIGPAALSALLSFSKEEVLVKAANDLAKALKVHDEYQPAVVESVKDENDTKPAPFEGMTVVFTGTLPGMSRTAAHTAVMQLGAKATPNTVSKSTTLVIEGEKGGKKAKQARDLGIRVMTAEEFLEMIS